MKKKEKKVESVKEPEVSSETTATGGYFSEASPFEEKKVDRLDLGFPNEDMNRVVAKLNEVIDKLNG